MMMDIFSSFDPFVYNSFSPMSLFIVINLVFVSSIQLVFWMSSSRVNNIYYLVVSLIYQQLYRTQMVILKGMSSMVSSVFFIIVFINLFGLMPYMFSTSSHLFFTLVIGLPVWISMIISSFSKAAKASIAHFLPDGAPDWLNPFLVLIETTSIIVRPLTLSFRLAANMSAGHIVLSLVGIYCSASMFSSLIGSVLLILVSIGYILFEVAICVIQAYIFCLLLSLYSDDHSH